MMTRAALAHGEWWRWFTAVWIADIGHLASNVVFGFLFLGLAMARYGPGVGLLAAYLAGVGGNVATGLVYDATMRGLGASGMVMGALGMLSVQSLALLKRRNANTFRLFAVGIMGGLLLFVFLGVSPGTDVVATWVDSSFRPVPWFAVGARTPIHPRAADKSCRRCSVRGPGHSALVVGADKVGEK